MIRNDFTKHKLRHLLDLKTDLQSTLKNQHCLSISEPTKHTISCIDSELASRGYLQIRKAK